MNIVFIGSAIVLAAGVVVGNMARTPNAASIGMIAALTGAACLVLSGLALVFG